MTYKYTGLFETSTLIYKQQMCDLLNLDRLNLTREEIERAYKKRARRFAPERQAQAVQPLPIELCNQLMADFSLAKRYLLLKIEYVPGDSHLCKRFFEYYLIRYIWSEILNGNLTLDSFYEHVVTCKLHQGLVFVSLYFISSLFIATSLPKFYKNTFILAEIIHQTYGSFLLIPYLLFTSIILPINLATQFTVQFSWEILRLFMHLVYHLFGVFYNTMQLMLSAFSYSSALRIFRNLIVITENILLFLPTLLNIGIYILTNNYYLEPLIQQSRQAMMNLIERIMPNGKVEPRRDVWLEKFLNNFASEEKVNTPLASYTPVAEIN
jgi:hypothetical protein